MSESLKIAKKALLEDAGLDEAFLGRALSTLSARHIDFGDLFFERTVYE